MVTKPVSNDELLRTIEAVRATDSNVEAAILLDVNESTVRRRMADASRRGLLGTKPVLPGFEITRISTRENEAGQITSTQIQQRPERGEPSVPNNMRLSGLSLNISPTGEVQRWEKYSAQEINQEEIASRLIAKFDGMSVSVPEIPLVGSLSPHYLNFFPMGDTHFGLRVAGRETGGEDWGVAKAGRVYRERFGALMSRVAPAQKCIIAIAGDSTHQDNRLNRTPSSGHPLDVDGSYVDAVEAAAGFFLDSAILAAQRHEEVILDLIGGNHDPHSIMAIAGFLQGVFRGHDRIKVRMPYNPFSVHHHGNVMIALTHGDMAKPKQMPGIMAARWPEMWGATKFRYAHCFHVHHKEKIKDEMGGAYVETYHSPAPQDAWHYGMGFLSGRSFEAVTYHAESGWRGNLVEPIVAT